MSNKTYAATEELIKVVIEPATDPMRAQSLLAARTIDHRVYSMGRRSASRAYCYDMEPPDCLIAQPYPYTVSRRHCEIERLPDGVIIRDLSSRLGTIVNGERLRVFHGQYSQVSLGEGAHSLVLGKSDGQVGFRVIVSKSVRQST